METDPTLETCGIYCVDHTLGACAWAHTRTHKHTYTHTHTHTHEVRSMQADATNNGAANAFLNKKGSAAWAKPLNNMF